MVIFVEYNNRKNRMIIMELTDGMLDQLQKQADRDLCNHVYQIVSNWMKENNYPEPASILLKDELNVSAIKLASELASLNQ